MISDVKIPSSNERSIQTRTSRLIQNLNADLSNIILFEQKKDIRKTKCRVYADGSISIEGPLTKPGLNIPIKLHSWFYLPKTMKDKVIEIKSIYVKDLVNDKIYRNVPVTIYNNGYRVYIRFNKSIDNTLQKIVKCRIKFDAEIMERITTSLFQKSRELILKTINDLPTKLEIYSFGSKQNHDWILYKANNKQLFLEISGTIDKKGQLGLSNELEKYIENWFKFEELFFCWNSHQPKVVQSKIHFRKNNKRKILKFSRNEVSRKVHLLISTTDLSLSSKAFFDKLITFKLRKSGMKVQHVKTEMRTSYNHWNKTIEEEFHNILRKSFPKDKFHVIHEPQILFDTDSFPFGFDDIVIFDVIIITKTENNLSKIFLCEIKTSMTLRHKSTKIDDALAYLSHYKDKFHFENLVPILMMNQDLYYGNKIITHSTGLLSDILIIGNQDFIKIKKNKMSLLTIIDKFLVNQKLLLKSSNNRIHPLQLKVIKKELLEIESINSLKGEEFLNSNKMRKKLRRYCQLMGLPFKIVHEILEEIYYTKSNEKTFYSQILEFHNNVISNGTLALLPFLKDKISKISFDIISKNEDLISQQIKPYYRFWKQMKIKSNYEKVVFNKLVKRKFDVMSNVMFHFFGRNIEIDHVAIRDKTISIISCKDLSETSIYSYLVNRIKFALNLIEFRKKQLGINQAFLFLNIPNYFEENVKRMIGNAHSVNGTRIIIN